MADEFYRDEHPENHAEELTPQWGGDGSGDGGGGGGGWGAGWGGGGGGGGGAGGSDESTEIKPEWYYGANSPWLRLSQDGHLLRSGPWLLNGTYPCPVVPLLLYIDEDTNHGHAECVRCGSAERQLTMCYLKGKIAAYGFFDWHTSGVFTIRAKWQSGHWNHAEINSVRFLIFGISIRKTLAMGEDIDIATIEIRDDATVWVNSIKADIAGNRP